jgi:hypothetical protein
VGAHVQGRAAVHGGAADRRGKTRHVACGNFKALRSAPILGKMRPWEGAGWPGRQRQRYGARAGAPAHLSTGGVAACQKVSDWQRLTEINSSFCN